MFYVLINELPEITFKFVILSSNHFDCHQITFIRTYIVMISAINIVLWLSTFSLGSKNEFLFLNFGVKFELKMS